jgi:hypothetical protein
MISQVRKSGMIPVRALALTVGISVFLGPAVAKGDGHYQPNCHWCGKAHKGPRWVWAPEVKYPPMRLLCKKCPHGDRGPGYGTLSYGGPSVYPGCWGFGLKFHQGYGYGANSLGTGAEGGYPYYGGPGYPHPWPKLNRFCGLTPFPFYGGPGNSGPPCLNYFGEPGQLAINEDVAGEGDRSDPSAVGGYGYGFGSAGYSDYGMFSGAIPYPESYFAPYTAAAAAMGSSAPLPAVPAETAARIMTAREFGIDEEPIVEPDGVRGMNVAAVYPGTLAQQAGIRPGDIIRSINHYLTIRPGDLGWIIANATPTSELTLYVRKLADGKAHAVTVRLP